MHFRTEPESKKQKAGEKSENGNASENVKKEEEKSADCEVVPTSEESEKDKGDDTTATGMDLDDKEWNLQPKSRITFKVS